MSIRVVIADDHPVVRDGLRLAIERSGQDIAVVAEASDGMEVLKAAREGGVDVFILDITMPKLNGFETARELLRESRTAKIIMLSLHDTQAMVEEALFAGARGYLTKEMATRNVIEAVSEVHAGRYYLCPAVAQFVVEASLMRKKESRKRAAAPASLSRQERKVLQLVAEGHSTKEIAKALHLSDKTVKNYLHNIFGKLNIRNRTQAALMYSKDLNR